jgi:Beta-ketoacyl synthase, N-terminal domain
VHNAAAAYWAMGVQSSQPVTCLGAHDDTLAAGLLAAMAELTTSGEPVLCCAYDVPLPPPLHAKQPIASGFGVALVLCPDTTNALARLEVAWQPEMATAPPDVPGDWQAVLRRENKLANILPLLTAMARGTEASLRLTLLDASVAVRVTP